MRYGYLRKWILMALIGAAILGSCKDAELRKPIENNQNKPGTVSDVDVSQIPGGARVTYALPDDPDLLYVKGDYTLATGEKKSVKSSYYDNSLDVVGFADTAVHQIELVAVNRSEVQSDPLTVDFKPGISPIWDIFDSLGVSPDFGGIRLKTKNPSRADIGIILLDKDEIGDWVANPESIYTSTDSINTSIRGYDTVNHDFAITIRDRWLNYTDTIFTTIKPLFEMALPKSGYRGMMLPGDATPHKTTLAGMWDGDDFNWDKIYMTEGTDTNPAVITFDLGVTAQLSRIIIWDYPEYFNDRTYYYQTCMKRFEIWGCTDSPPADGSFDTWFKLGTYQETKPSGLPYGEQSDEDFETARAGFNWDFDPSSPKVRYMRIKCLENWGGGKSLSIAELQVYGDPR